MFHPHYELVLLKGEIFIKLISLFFKKGVLHDLRKILHKLPLLCETNFW